MGTYFSDQGFHPCDNFSQGFHPCDNFSQGFHP